nr:RNA-directed DNA polymerase, eukaryota [Tanacetum cinerariifolium]
MKVLQILESIRCNFFNGQNYNSKKSSWFSWKKVLASKVKGGLGVSSLYALNRSLLLKWVWRFYTQPNSLWVRVVKAIHGVEGKIGAAIKPRSKSCWLNIVYEIEVLRRKGINVFEFMNIKVGNGLSMNFWGDKWIGVQNVILAPLEDRWKWNLESSGVFSVASMRKRIDDTMLPEVNSKLRWIKFVPIKVNVHVWKVKNDALPTRFNISRRGIAINSLRCEVCSNGVETVNHLFFSCCLVREVTKLICHWWDIPFKEIMSYKDWLEWIVSLRIPVNNKKMFEGVFYVLWWHIWTFRNKLLFDAKDPVKAVFFDEVVSMSFYWCRFRCKVVFSWIDWLKSPNLISL